MKETILYHGIPIVGRMPLFTFDNRQAVRDDRKGQTRRVIKGIPKEANIITCSTLEEDDKGNLWCSFGSTDLPMDPGGYETLYTAKYPHGKVGDVRCMCEPLVLGLHGLAYYGDAITARLMNPVISLITGKPIKWRWKRDCLASIHMPTEAARTIRRTTDIRVEWLQGISAEDALAEGMPCMGDETGSHDKYIATGGRKRTYIDPQGRQCTCYSAKAEFADIWDSINAKRGYGWDAPQMVWVNVFEKLEV